MLKTIKDFRMQRTLKDLRMLKKYDIESSHQTLMVTSIAI